MTERAPLLQISYRDPQEGWEGMLVIDSLVDGTAGDGQVRRLHEGRTVRLSRDPLRCPVFDLCCLRSRHDRPPWLDRLASRHRGSERGGG